MNAIVGKIPATAAQKLSRLEQLNLGANLISGTLPTEIGLLAAALKELQVFNNGLEGTLPSERGLLTDAVAIVTFENFFPVRYRQSLAG